MATKNKDKVLKKRGFDDTQPTSAQKTRNPLAVASRIEQQLKNERVKHTAAQAISISRIKALEDQFTEMRRKIQEKRNKENNINYQTFQDIVPSQKIIPDTHNDPTIVVDTTSRRAGENEADPVLRIPYQYLQFVIFERRFYDKLVGKHEELANAAKE
ncbi:hypothetical protein B0O99DRAFT_695496 [Bisporella sp. PMI_857]|nr:hypothetical protein B0O99DRAFT_695496 [Bisporella sp. PMI_857]